MALWPNGRHMTRSTYKGVGPGPGGYASTKGLGDRMNRFVGEGFTHTASTPDGYGMRGYVPPLTAGSLSAMKPVASVDGVGSLLQGGPMEGSATVVEMAGAAGLSMIVSMSGTSTVATLTGNGMTLALTMGLTGSGSLTLTGTSGLSMIVPFAGTGSVALMGGTSDLRGRLSLVGEWTPFTELSPEGLAAAVWGSMLATYQGDGTAGKALSAASSGGVDYQALGAAVWSSVSRTLTSGAGTAPTTAEISAAIQATLAPSFAAIPAATWAETL